ncbi:MAG: hypothetical protein M3135_03130 [Actinomycetota bacterium]|nr:hypothetical protein [Actinomycetota bacterium]
MTEPPVPPAALGSDGSRGPSDDVSTEPPADDTIRAVRITPATVVALFGSAAIAVSSVLAWANEPFVTFDNPSYPVVFSLPSLLNPKSIGRIPSVAIVLLAFGGITATLVLITPLGRWVDPLRRVLGLLVLGICVLFVVRFAAFFEGSVGAELFGDLRAGFYLAAAGGLAVVTGGRLPRRG